MNYAWEAVLAADASGVLREELRFVPACGSSPYTEIVQENINGQEIENPEIKLNPLYRFAREFSAMFDANLEGFEKTREIFFDSFMHYMVQMDLRQGMSKQEYAMDGLFRDLAEGVCGNWAAEAVRQFRQLGKDKLNSILRLVVRLYQCGSSVYLFKEAVLCIYPKAFIYTHNEGGREVLVYLGMKKTEEEQKRLEFLQGLFLSVDISMCLFWEHHFGIMGIDETMVMGEMVVF